MSPIAVYIHVPFCPSKCGYCDFNSYAMTGEIVGRTVDAIRTEILRSPYRGIPAKTIFFGGGTPTYISAPQLIGLLDAIREVHPPVSDCEITSEANPGTVDQEKFAEMVEAGFNRISLGAQSFLDSDLIRLERVHQGSEIERAVTAARQAGFQNLNLDLMFALPDQTSRAWHQNLNRALDLKPEHLSLYCLTIEQNTAFYKKHLKNELNLPDDETQRQMYDDCIETCEKSGFRLYEISNFCQAERECQHNLCYWRAEDYAAYGPGAVGCMTTAAGRFRTTNYKHPLGYCERIENGEPAPFESEELNEEVQQMERIMLGLRLSEGVLLNEFQLKSSKSVVSRGWVELEGNRARLTAEGRHFCSEVALELV